MDIDVLPGVNQGNVTGLLRTLFDSPFDPALDPVPPEWQVGSNLFDHSDPLFSNNALFQLALRNGVGRGDGRHPGVRQRWRHVDHPGRARRGGAPVNRRNDLVERRLGRGVGFPIRPDVVRGDLRIARAPRRCASRSS